MGLDDTGDPLVAGNRNGAMAPNRAIVQSLAPAAAAAAAAAVPVGERQRHHRVWQEPMTRAATNREPVASQWTDAIRAIAEHGDRARFEALFRHFAPRLKGYFARLGTPLPVAEELVQETMVLVWRKAALFDPGQASVATWIFTIARNLRIDAFRHNRAEFDPNDPALVPEPDPPADQVLFLRAAAGELGRAIKALPDEQQAVLRLSFYEDKPHAAIAAQLQIPLGTVKSRLRLAFRRIRAALDESLGERL